MELDEIGEFIEGAVLLDGLDEAIVGVVESFGNGPRVLYDRQKIINILMRNSQMDELEAFEYYEYNVLGLFAGEQTPLFLTYKIK